MTQAYPEAVRRRALGQAFYGMVLYEEPRINTIYGFAAAALSQIQEFDQRNVALEQLAAGTIVLGTRKASEVWSPDTLMTQAIGELFALSSAVLVRSCTEWMRLSAFCQRPRPFEVAVLEPVLPPIERRPPERPSIVIWAPNRIAEYAAWHVFALSEFFGDVTCVAAPSVVPAGLKARYMLSGDPLLPEVLATANAIVCVEPEDPGAAIAFARRGYGVIAPLSSGAHEFVRGVTTYEGSNLRELQVAASVAIGRPAAVRVEAPPIPVLATPGFAPEEDVPLVSVIVLTYDRPDDLERCLTSLAHQTYPRMEVVVMNDAGENVDHIVARFPFARPVNIAVNGGVLKAIIKGFTEVKGNYVQLLADDDTLYPDHITRLMKTMLATGAAVAHGNTVMHYQNRRDDGSVLTTGFNAIVFNDTTTATQALICTPIAGQSLIIRRDIIDEIGGFRDDCILADQEFQLRAANRYVFAYVDHMTAEWRVRGKSNFSATVNSREAQRQVYEELHPLTERPLIDAHRRATLENIGSRPPGFIFPPSITFVGRPESGPPA
jgi:GT2 family glycosyltransferase